MKRPCSWIGRERVIGTGSVNDSWLRLLDSLQILIPLQVGGKLRMSYWSYTLPESWQGHDFESLNLLDLASQFVTLVCQ